MSSTNKNNKKNNNSNKNNNENNKQEKRVTFLLEEDDKVDDNADVPVVRARRDKSILKEEEDDGDEEDDDEFEDKVEKDANCCVVSWKQQRKSLPQHPPTKRTSTITRRTSTTTAPAHRHQCHQKEAATDPAMRDDSGILNEQGREWKDNAEGSSHNGQDYYQSSSKCCSWSLLDTANGDCGDDNDDYNKEDGANEAVYEEFMGLLFEYHRFDNGKDAEQSNSSTTASSQDDSMLDASSWEGSEHDRGFDYYVSVSSEEEEESLYEEQEASFIGEKQNEEVPSTPWQEEQAIEVSPEQAEEISKQQDQVELQGAVALLAVNGKTTKRTTEKTNTRRGVEIVSHSQSSPIKRRNLSKKLSPQLFKWHSRMSRLSPTKKEPKGSALPLLSDKKATQKPQRESARGSLIKRRDLSKTLSPKLEKVQRRMSRNSNSAKKKSSTVDNDSSSSTRTKKSEKRNMLKKMFTSKSRSKGMERQTNGTSVDEKPEICQVKVSVVPNGEFFSSNHLASDQCDQVVSTTSSGTFEETPVDNIPKIPTSPPVLADQSTNVRVRATKAVWQDGLNSVDATSPGEELEAAVRPVERSNKSPIISLNSRTSSCIQEEQADIVLSNKLGAVASSQQDSSVAPTPGVLSDQVLATSSSIFASQDNNKPTSDMISDPGDQKQSLYSHSSFLNDDEQEDEVAMRPTTVRVALLAETKIAKQTVPGHGGGTRSAFGASMRGVFVKQSSTAERPRSMPSSTSKELNKEQIHSEPESIAGTVKFSVKSSGEAPVVIHAIDYDLDADDSSFVQDLMAPPAEEENSTSLLVVEHPQQESSSFSEQEQDRHGEPSALFATPPRLPNGSCTMNNTTMEQNSRPSSESPSKLFGVKSSPTSTILNDEGLSKLPAGFVVYSEALI